MERKNILIISICIIMFIVFGIYLEQSLLFYWNIIRDFSDTIISKYYFESIILFFLITLILINFPIPLTTFTFLLAGYLYGPYFGTIINLCSVTLGSYLGYLFYSKILNKMNIEKYTEKLNKKYLKKHTFHYLFNLRIIGFFPYEHLNIISAGLKLKQKDFIYSTILGSLPIVFLFAHLGALNQTHISLNLLFNLTEVIICFVVIFIIGNYSILKNKSFKLIHKFLN